MHLSSIHRKGTWSCRGLFQKYRCRHSERSEESRNSYMQMISGFFAPLRITEMKPMILSDILLKNKTDMICS